MLRFADSEHTLSQVDVAAGQAQSLPDPHPGDGEQPQQRLVRRGPERIGQPTGRAQQPADVPRRPQIRGGSWGVSGPDPGWWHLHGRVDRLQVLREAARDAEPVRQRDGS